MSRGPEENLWEFGFTVLVTCWFSCNVRKACFSTGLLLVRSLLYPCDFFAG